MMDTINDNEYHLPTNWVLIEIGDFPIYWNTLDFTLTFAVPFEMDRLETMYKKFYGQPLYFSQQELFEQFEKLRLRPTKINYKPALPPTEKGNKVEEQTIAIMTQEAKIIPQIEPISIEPDLSGLAKNADPNISLANVNLKVADVVSLFRQTWEWVKKCRPEIKFDQVKNNQRWIIKFNSELISQVVQTNNKKAKHLASDIAMRRMFPKLYNDWLLLHPNVAKDLDEYRGGPYLSPQSNIDEEEIVLSVKSDRSLNSAIAPLVPDEILPVPISLINPIDSLDKPTSTNELWGSKRQRALSTDTMESVDTPQKS